jgi:hypothetical protein
MMTTTQTAETTYLSTTDRAAIIRKALKAKGWNSRDVSVRADYYSMGSSLRIVIKNADVPLSVVEAIANEHESIDRDQFGEILSGGNRFVDVGYSSAANAVLTARCLPIVASAAAALDSSPTADRSLYPVEGTDYLIGRGYCDSGYALWHKDSGHVQTANTPDYLASVLAVRLQVVKS